jgi:uncharacterized membrane protein
LFAILLPPFQVPDEFQHYNYALAISHGSMLSKDYSGTLGAELPVTAVELEGLFEKLPFQPENKVTRSTLDQFYGTRDSLTMAFHPIAGVSLYPAFVYAIPAAAMFVARMLGAQSGMAFIAGRLANAVAFVLIGMVALRYLASGHALFLFALLLPGTVQQAASFSADCLSFAVAALAISLTSHATGRTASHRLLWAAAALWIVLSISKLPYALLSLTTLGTLDRGRSSVLAWLTPIGSALAAVSWAALFSASATWNPGVDPKLQIWGLLTHPLAIFNLVQKTFADSGNFYWNTFVGVFGWLDTPLPNWTYLVVAALFTALIITSLAASIRRRAPLGPRLIFGAASLLSAGMVFAALYFTWTPVDAPSVLGVQGRYFVPAALAGIVAVAGTTTSRMKRIEFWLVAAVVSVSFPFAIFSIMQRYYLQ